MPRLMSAAEASVVQLRDYGVHYRLLAYREPLENILGIDPLLSWTITQDVEQPAMSASFVCDLLGPGHTSGAASLSQWISTGATINPGTGPVPILSEGRALQMQIQCVASGAAPTAGGWRMVFDGLIDDVTVDPVGGTVTASCRDIISARLNTQIENITTNEDGEPAWGFLVPASDVMTGALYVLNTAWNYSYGNDAGFDVQVTGDPQTEISEYWQERTSIYEAMLALLVGKNGWDFRGRWDGPNGPDSYVPTYFNPPRDVATADPSFFTNIAVPGNCTRLSRDASGVRNVIEVTPADGARVPVIRENAASIARYGRRFMAVSEDVASHIDTPEEAAILAQSIADYLGFPKASVDAEVVCGWWLQLHDIFVIGTDGYSFDLGDTTNFCVTRIVMAADEKGVVSTTVTGRELGATVAARTWRASSAILQPKKTYERTTPRAGPAAEGARYVQVTAA